MIRTGSFYLHWRKRYRGNAVAGSRKLREKRIGRVCDATHSKRIGKRYFRLAGFGGFASLSFLAFCLFSISAARTAAAIFSASILYRAAVRARFDSFIRDWLRMYPGHKRSDTRAHKTTEGRRSGAFTS